MSLESPPIPPTLESDSGLARVVLAPTAHELRLPIRHIAAHDDQVLLGVGVRDLTMSRLRAHRADSR